MGRVLKGSEEGACETVLRNAGPCPCRNGPRNPGTPKQVVREGSTLRFRLERIGYLNIASICSRKHEWGLNTMPHPNFFGVLKGSGEGACDGAPSAASFVA